MSNIQLFNNGEFELSVEYLDDTFRVYGPHLAQQLGYAQATDMLRALDDDEKVLVTQLRTSAVPRDQEVWWVTEPGFFRVVGQRKIGWIKNAATREFVSRFQRWVFHEVLPSIRKHGRYDVVEPASLTWEQFSQVLYQRYGLKLSAPQITGALKSAGVLRQNGNPRTKFQDWFWFTDANTVNVLSFTVPKVAAQITETRMRLLERHQWYQARLELNDLHGLPTTLTP